MKIIVRCWYSIMPKLDPNPVVKEGGLDWSMARLTNSIHVKPIRLCRNDIFGKHRQKRERMSSVRLSTSTPPNIKPLIDLRVHGVICSRPPVTWLGCADRNRPEMPGLSHVTGGRLQMTPCTLRSNQWLDTVPIFPRSRYFSKLT